MSTDVYREKINLVSLLKMLMKSERAAGRIFLFSFPPGQQPDLHQILLPPERLGMGMSHLILLGSVVPTDAGLDVMIMTLMLSFGLNCLHSRNCSAAISGKQF